jgi:hypothetical protein
MKKTLLIGTALAASTLLLVLARTPAADGPAEPKKALGALMKEKLRLSQTLLQGLTEEDFDLLGDSATRLKAVSEDAALRLSPSVTYVKYSAEFSSIAEELARRAKQRDLNGSTLSYIRLAINCIDCHKFVRDNRILDPKSRGE